MFDKDKNISLSFSESVKSIQSENSADNNKKINFEEYNIIDKNNKFSSDLNIDYYEHFYN